MPNHLRQQIRAQVVQTLTGLPLTGARVFEDRLDPLTDAELPGLVVTTPEEAAEVVTTGYPHHQERRLVVDVSAVVKAASGYQASADQIAADVEAAIAGSSASFQANGLATGGIRYEGAAIEVDGSLDRPVAVCRMRFAATYYTTNNAPTAAL